MEMVDGAPALADGKRVRVLDRLGDEDLPARDRLPQRSALGKLSGDGRRQRASGAMRVARGDTRRGEALDARFSHQKIDGLLAKSGSNKSKLLSATVYISNMAHKDAMNEAWMAWIDRKNPPTRACVAVELGRTGVREVVGEERGHRHIVIPDDNRYPSSDFHISISRSAVQIRGSGYCVASS